MHLVQPKTRAPWKLEILAVLSNLGVLNGCVHVIQILHNVCVVTTHRKVHWAVAILHDMGSQSREMLSLADSMWAKHWCVGPYYDSHTLHVGSLSREMHLCGGCCCDF